MENSFLGSNESASRVEKSDNLGLIEKLKGNTTEKVNPKPENRTMGTEIDVEALADYKEFLKSAEKYKDGFLEKGEEGITFSDKGYGPGSTFVPEGIDIDLDTRTEVQAVYCRPQQAYNTGEDPTPSYLLRGLKIEGVDHGYLTEEEALINYYKNIVLNPRTNEETKLNARTNIEQLKNLLSQKVQQYQQDKAL